MKAIAHVKVAELTNGFERAKKLGFLKPTKRFYKNFSVILLSNLENKRTIINFKLLDLNSDYMMSFSSIFIICNLCNMNFSTFYGEKVY